MTKLEKTLVRQSWWRRYNLYPGQIWYREAGTAGAWLADDDAIVVMKADLFPGDAIPQEIRVTVEWPDPPVTPAPKSD